MFTEGDETVKIELNAESFAQHFLLKKYSGETHGIEIKPMDNIPAIKVTQLAVDQLYAQRYRNVGKNMIFFARMLACRCSEIAACSILTVDADVETNLGVDQFYEKCGFQRLKREISQKRKRIGNDVALKTIPMWSPLFI